MTFLETIRYEDGRFDLLELHQQRMNRSRKALLHCTENLLLSDYLRQAVQEFSERKPVINRSPLRDDGMMGPLKCRVIYAKTIEKIEILPYRLPPVRSLKVVYDDRVEYAHKYADRSRLQQLLEQRGGQDEILIVQHGRITDTSYANILFYDGKEWVTPEHPLLMGTRRESLLSRGILKAVPIGIGDLNRFVKARLVNAMIRFEDRLDINITNIIL